MTIDFDTIIDRSNTDSSKYSKYRDTGILPLWVADMDFRSPEPVIEALTNRVQHGVFGYTRPSDQLIELIIERLARLYDWHIGPEDIVFIPGVVAGLNLCCRAYTAPGEAVITAVPIYPPFMSAPEYSRRELVKVPATYEDGLWEFPLAGLAEAATGPGRLLLLCNPYNPVGRALNREELSAVVDICRSRGLIICSDEIHCDLIFDGKKHIPTATISGDAAEITVTLMSPSKTFNLAGLGGSFAIIQNPDLRERFKRETRGIIPNVDLMAFTGMLAAYRDGEEWYRALIEYLEANRDFLFDALGRLPSIRMNRVEATYLAWLDVSALGLADPPAFFESVGIGMSEGYRFGDDRFMRLNFGCPRKTLEEAVARFERAL
jgi:cystathionine beta-lyase